MCTSSTLFPFMTSRMFWADESFVETTKIVKKNKMIFDTMLTSKKIMTMLLLLQKFNLIGEKFTVLMVFVNAIERPVDQSNQTRFCLNKFCFVALGKVLFFFFAPKKLSSSTSSSRDNDNWQFRNWVSFEQKDKETKRTRRRQFNWIRIKISSKNKINTT